MSFDALHWGPPAGRTVLLLHGFPQRNTSWSEIAVRLADLGLRVVAVSQRGYSPGARPTEVSAYALRELVADAVALIDALGGTVDLAGHDFGAVLLADDPAYFGSMFGRDSVPPAQVDADVAYFSQPGVLTAALNWYRAMNRHDADEVPHVRVPTTYIWGSEDPAFDRAAAEETRFYVDAPYTFVPLEGAGHWLLDEATDTVAESLAELIVG